MRSFSLGINHKMVLLFVCSIQTILAFGQNINAVKPIKKTVLQIHKAYKPLQLGGDSNLVVINYDSADAEAWGSANYTRDQVQLMNMNYRYPTDSSISNYYVINYFAIAFDSLIDPYINKSVAVDSISQIVIDTIIVPIVQVNHSGLNDTLDIQLNSVDANGYPTASVLNDTKIVSKLIGDTNSNSVINYIKIPENYNLPSGTKFAVTVKYYGPKIDSCWFIYGYGSFVGSCDGGVYTLAEPSNFSKVQDSKGSFIANSFIQYNKYQSTGFYPTNNGSVLFYDCTGDSAFSGGSDGASYFQNIDVFAMITTVPLGINELQKNDFTVAQNFPNPFNTISQINYRLTKQSDVDFSVSDITGRKLYTENYKKVSPGEQSIRLNCEQFVPGVYFYSFGINGVWVTRKMVVSK
jgi:hypothetical protein